MPGDVGWVRRRRWPMPRRNQESCLVSEHYDIHIFDLYGRNPSLSHCGRAIANDFEAERNISHAEAQRRGEITEYRSQFGFLCAKRERKWAFICASRKEPFGDS